MSVLSLVRPDLREFAGYSSARSSARADTSAASVWLNANESPYANPTDLEARQRRYPDPQPAALRDALANLYDVSSDRLLIGRGSDEAIDLLVRVLCRAGQDAVVVSTPVFGMYAVCARLQNAPLIDVPLIDDVDGFRSDVQAVGDAALGNGARLVFVCSPGNPTGQVLPLADIAGLAQRLLGQAIVAVDEAYGEFSEQPSATTLLDQHPNLAVLRTLSKAHALAAARIGLLIADAELIAALRRCQAPYPLPASSVQVALDALSAEARRQTAERVVESREQRDTLIPALRKLAGIRRVYPSQGNFVLVRFDDTDAAFDRLLEAGIVVRDMRGMPQLGDALRISIGSPEQNRRVLVALAGNNQKVTA